MKLLTKPIELMLIKNHNERNETGHDPRPPLKLFDPCGASTWLITEYDPETKIFFGLADLGHGFPELGSTLRSDIEGYRGRYGLGIERDRGFTPNKTLSMYAAEARDSGRLAA